MVVQLFPPPLLPTHQAVKLVRRGAFDMHLLLMLGVLKLQPKRGEVQSTADAHLGRSVLLVADDRASQDVSAVETELMRPPRPRLQAEGGDVAKLERARARSDAPARLRRLSIDGRINQPLIAINVTGDDSHVPLAHTSLGEGPLQREQARLGLRTEQQTGCWLVEAVHAVWTV